MFHCTSGWSLIVLHLILPVEYAQCRLPGQCLESASCTAHSICRCGVERSGWVSGSWQYKHLQLGGHCHHLTNQQRSASPTVTRTTGIVGQKHNTRISSWLLEFYILAASKVISGWVLTCDSIESWRLHSVAPLGDQAASTMSWYPTQLYYPETGPTSPCPILIMPSTWLWSDMYKLLSYWIYSTRVWSPQSTKAWDRRSTYLAIPNGHMFEYIYI